jgi:hypothetical protein
MALGYASCCLHVRSTLYLTWEGGRQLLHFTSAEWTPLHLSFLSWSQLSNETWATSEMNYWSIQWTHFPFGPWLQSIFATAFLSLRSTYEQFKHFPVGPCKHRFFMFYFFSVLLYEPISKQLMHFPPSAWLHLISCFSFLFYLIFTVILWYLIPYEFLWLAYYSTP